MNNAKPPFEPGAARPTAADVARRAGVSRTTVSFVLNGQMDRRGITEGTTARVRAAADELGYLPHKAARMLQSGRSDLVVFVVPAETAMGTLAAAITTELSTALVPLGLDLVIRRATPGALLQRFWRDLAPVVVIGFNLSAEDVREMENESVVAVDLNPARSNRSVGALQANHLLTRGHTALAYVAPLDHELGTYAKDRLAGVQRSCADAAVADPVVLSIGLDVMTATYALAGLKRDHSEVTGICVYNDDYSFAILAAAAHLKLPVPECVAVIGVDDIPLAALALPALTTVRFERKAVLAAIVDRIRERMPTLFGESIFDLVGAPQIVSRMTT